MEDRLAQLLTFLKEDPSDSFLLFAVAKEHEKLGNNTKALSYYEILKEKDPDYIGLYYHLGKILEVLEHPKIAISTYKEGIHLAKRKSDFHAASELNGALEALGEEFTD